LIARVSGPRAIDEVRDELAAAHAYLVDAARRVSAALAAQEPSRWGSRVKRLRVDLSAAGRPSLVPETVREQSFVEVVNQCATVERLLDALEWAATPSAGLAAGRVLLCNPTTSSSRETNDHDLVIEMPSGDLAKLEVSDVAGGNDGNRKEVKDLTSLGVLDSSGKVRGPEEPWPSGRLLLVTSSELAARLREPTRHGLKAGAFHYDEVKDDGETRIFEVKEGPRPSAGSQREQVRRVPVLQVGAEGGGLTLYCASDDAELTWFWTSLSTWDPERDGPEWKTFKGAHPLTWEDALAVLDRDGCWRLFALDVDRRLSARVEAALATRSIPERALEQWRRALGVGRATPP
jgi:hypothetical protein